MSTFIYDDGGRVAAGFKGSTGDCCVRAVAIATGRPYQEIYDAINKVSQKLLDGTWVAMGPNNVHRIGL